jgi:hypothetical protein
MTTLRNFQNAIEEIHNRELAKQKAQAATTSDKDLNLKKKDKGKASESPHASASPSGACDPLEFEEKILVIELS